MNREAKLFGTAVLLLAFIDMPWLLMIGETAQKMVLRIQGSELQVRFLPALVVYIALAFLVLKTETPWEAFQLGVAVYAVYDFTNLALFKQYSFTFAVMDTLWGGLLLAATRYALNRIF